MQFPESKHLNLSIDDEETTCPVAKALSSPVRLQILRALGVQSMHVNEIAEKLNLPVSTAALNVRMLEEAGLIRSEQQPGARGTMKLCNRRMDSIGINLVPQEEHRDSVLALSLPVGCYSFAEDIEPTCGLAGTRFSIGEDDNPRSFFCQDRFQAQLLWFRHGYITYHFSVLSMRDIHVQWLEISFEACSEAPMYRDPWKSDIELAVNGVPIGIWTSPCDCGGRRGLLNPPWWSDMSTQYGMLKTWRIDQKGSTLENMPLSDVTLDDLHVYDNPYISLRLGVSKEAEHVGGMNLFGKGFGDFAQDIVMKVGYSMR